MSKRKTNLKPCHVKNEGVQRGNMERNVLVDRLKGYACFLVLFGHVIRGIRTAGVPVPRFFEGMELFIWSFHVALFLFLSGVVYRLGGEWRGHNTKRGFIFHKLLGLGIPYVVFSALYICINSLVGGTNTQSSLKDILLIWKTPVAQYWYLYALFFLFCIWVALSGFLKNWQIADTVSRCLAERSDALRLFFIRHSRLAWAPL